MNAEIPILLINDLSGKRLGALGIQGELFPMPERDGLDARCEGCDVVSHAQLYPISGKPSTHRREAGGAHSLERENYKMGLSRPNRYGISDMGVRDTFAENLRTLISMEGPLSSTLAIERATEAIGCKVGKSTIDRATRSETPINIDYVEAIAAVFGFDAWQMLVPGLQPKNPPILKSVGATEDEIYRKIRGMADKLEELSAQRATNTGDHPKASPTHRHGK